MADPFLDALGVKDPTADAAPAPAAAAAPAAQATYDPTDLAVRLAMLEDASPEGRAAVAGVMANRAKTAKGGLLEALTAPKACEPWATKQNELAPIDPNSDDYKATAAAILPILQGKAPNPVGQATNFYSPESQAALAGDGQHPAQPSFDDGSGVRIGGNLFFRTGQAGGDTFLSTLGVDPSKAVPGAADAAASGPSTIAVKNGKVVFGDTGQPVPDAQAKALSALVASGRLKADGTIDGKAVWMQRNPSDAFTPGDFYLEAGTGKLKGGPQESSFGGGAAQGVEDVGLSLTSGLEKIPGLENSGVTNFLRSQQQIYDATHAGDMKSGFGRFTGQVVGSAPLLAGVEVPAAAGLAKLGPVGDFLAGVAGKEMAPGLARLGVRAGSLAAKGAGEGAGAAGLTSSASDQPLAEQLGEGALGGALLSPLVHGGAGLAKGAVNGVRGLIEPHTANGPANIAERRIAEVLGLGPSQAPDLTVHIPGSTPTLAEATASAPLAQMQRNLSQNPLTAGVFQAADDANNAARQAVTGNAQGDLNTVADLARVRANAVDSHKAAVIAAAAPAEAQPVVKAIDEALASPEANTPGVSTALSKAREALVTEPDKALTPEESAAFHQAALGTAGGSGKALTPEAMDAAKQALGAKFNAIADQTNMAWDDKLRGDISEAIKTAADVVPDSQLPPLFKRLDDIASTSQQTSEAAGLGHVESTPATISGASYQELTRSKGALDSLMKDNGAVGVAARKIREALDDALERSVTASQKVDEATGLPLNADGTVTVYHHTDPEAAAKIRKSGVLRSAGESDVYVTTHRDADTGYGSEAVPIRVKPEQLQLDDEFPNGRRDFRIDVGGPAGSTPVGVGEADPNATDELRATRLAYKNLKTLEAARRTAGPDGQITPQALYGAVKQNFGNYAYKGGGPLGDVAEAALKAQAEKGPVYQQDPGQLFALRDNLQSQIDKLAKAGETDDASRAAATRLSQVRDAMDQALEKANPDYARFRQIADSTAEPIEAQRYLQGLSLTTNGAKGGTVTLNLVNKALDRIDTARSLPGPHPAKAITPETLAQLRALKADLEREANRNMGKAKGSETNQLGSAQAEFGAMGAPLLVAQHVAGKVPLVGPHVAQAVGRASQAANERVMSALASRLLNPEPIVQQGVQIRPPAVQGLGRVLATVPGAAGGILGSRLLGTK